MIIKYVMKGKSWRSFDKDTFMVMYYHEKQKHCL